MEQGSLCLRLILQLTARAIVVADTGNHRLQVLRQDGTHVRTIGGKGDLNVHFVPCYLIKAAPGRT